MVPAPARDYASVNVDGGLINNEPFEFAHFALFDHGQATNNRAASDADRAVIMVDPFPEDPTFVADDREIGLGLAPIALRLFSALKNQARFKPDELALALSDDVFSRFLIAPQRTDEKGDDVREGLEIATGLLGGFGGFLDRQLRAFDYQLGRRNCQRFLGKIFGLDPSNPLFADWRDTVDAHGEKLSDDPRFLYTNEKGEKRLCIVPLIADARAEVVMPAWPRLGEDRLQQIEERIIKRANAIVPRMIERETASRFFRAALKAGWSVFGPKRVREYIHLKIQQDLVRRDQHAEYRFADDDERLVFSELANPAYEFRTLDGLERRTGLPQQVIQRIIDARRDQVYAARSPSGVEGYTLVSRKPSWVSRNIGTPFQSPRFG